MDKESQLINLVSDIQYPSMYWLEWSSGERSGDFYNLSWASQHRITFVETGRG
jgi:hypothetical protein